MKPFARATCVLAAVALVGACGARHTPLASYSTRDDHASAPEAVAPNTTVFATSEKPPLDVVLGSPTGDDDFKNTAAALGKEPPEISVDGWVGITTPIYLRNLQGRVIVLVFCALDDARCNGAHQQMLLMQGQYADRKDFEIIELFTDQALDDDADRGIAQGIARHNFPWPAGYGKQVDYAKLRYGFPDLPAAYLIDRDGKVVWSGRIGVEKDTLSKALATVLAEPP